MYSLYTKVNYMCSLLDCSLANVRLLAKKKLLSRLVWFVFHWAKQEMESFPHVALTSLKH